jgi:hypothetical protein
VRSPSASSPMPGDAPTRRAPRRSSTRIRSIFHRQAVEGLRQILSTRKAFLVDDSEIK